MQGLVPLRSLLLCALGSIARGLEVTSSASRVQPGAASDDPTLPAPPPVHDVVPLPRHTVNLDLAPELRWQNITRHNRDELIEIMDWWAQTMSVTNSSIVQQWMTSHDIEEEYLRELRGIVEAAAHPSVTLDNLVLLQLAYELDWPHFCMSIIAAMPNGTVVHGRNFDFYGEGGLTYMIRFERAGEHLFTEVTRPGLIGVHTAFRPHSYSLAMNKRTVRDRLGYQPADHQAALNLASAQHGGRSYMLLLRKTLEQASDFKTALSTLSTAKFAAPLYLTLAGSGPFEGAVVTVDRCQPGGSESLDVRRLDRSDNWFIVQANEDQWQARHGRRHLQAKKDLLRIGQYDFSQRRLRTVMTTPPLLFNHMTQFTWVMTASTGAFDMVLADQSWRRSTGRPSFARERKTRVANGRLEWDVPEHYMEALDEDPEVMSNPAGL